MPHISRKRLPKKISQQILDSLFFVFADIKNKNQIASFLDALLSNTEKLMLAKRLAAVYLLEEGISEEKIARALNLTQATVSKIKLKARIKKKSYKIGVNRVKKEQLLKELKTLALKFGAYVGRADGGRRFPRRNI